MQGKTAAMTIDEIYIYPIKSCGGVRLQQATVDDPGLAHDRRWMIVDESHNFVSQRRAPQMARIAVEVIWSWQHSNVPMPTLKLRFRSESGDVTEELIISPRDEMQDRVSVRVWEDTVEARVYPDTISSVLSRWLGFPCQLVKIASSYARFKQNKANSNNYALSFADSAPVLLANRASAAALGEHHGKTIDILRFRPNLIVSGATAFSEEAWNTIGTDSVSFETALACKRCLMIEIDQNLGQRNEALMKSLLAVRQDLKADTQLLFGLKLVPTLKGVLREGDVLYAH